MIQYNDLIRLDVDGKILTARVGRTANNESFYLRHRYSSDPIKINTVLTRGNTCLLMVDLASHNFPSVQGGFVPRFKTMEHLEKFIDILKGQLEKNKAFRTGNGALLVRNQIANPKRFIIIKSETVNRLIDANLQKS